MQADFAEHRLGRAGELEHPGDQGINAAHFVAHHVHEFGVLVFLQQQINEGPAGDEGILDLVGHAGGQRADIGQPIKLRDVLVELPRRGQVVEHDRDA